MPLIEAGGLRQYYRLEGRDNFPALIFSHSLGCDHTQWDPQAAALAPHFRVLRYDTRGHGATDVPRGDYSIEQLARDALALADALNIRQFAWCGLSLGGMIGQWIGANAADRLSSLALANTSARMGDPSIMEARRRTALEEGLAAIEPTTMGRFFSPERVAANPPVVAERRRVLLATDPNGYAGCCAAIRDMNNEPLLSHIKTRTLIIVGDHDPSTPWQPHGETLARNIAGAEVQRFRTAHLSNLEAPHSFTAALLKFLLPEPEKAVTAGAPESPAHVEGERIEAVSPGVQHALNRHLWGGVVQRSGLDDRTRSLLAITTTAAQGHWEEYRKQVREALAAGMETCDLEETLLQLALHAGQPAANSAMQIATEEMSEN